MTIFLGILLTFLVFFVVVMIHEFGHFITARWTGMRVLEFGLGIPPKIKKVFTDKKWTEFTLNALPIGGFVRIDGEDFSKPSAFKDGAFMSKSLPKRLLVLVAGVVMNLILAWVIFSAMFFVGTKPLTIIPLDVGRTNSFFLPSFQEGIEMGMITHSGIRLDPIENSVAQKAGLLAGDVVLSVNNQKISAISDVIGHIEKNQPLSFQIQRNNEEKIIQVVPENGKIGTAIGYANLQINESFSKKVGIFDAMKMGAKETYHSSILTFTLVKKTFWALFFPKDEVEHNEAKNNLSGPIGAWNAFVQMVEHSVPASIIFLFVALLSVNLAVMNILPFPALDGGRIVLTTLYSIGKRLGFKKESILRLEWYINTLGFVVLLLFMLYVAKLDIFRFFQ